MTCSSCWKIQGWFANVLLYTVYMNKGGFLETHMQGTTADKGWSEGWMDGRITGWLAGWRDRTDRD